MSAMDAIIPDPTAIVVVPFYCEARFAPQLQQGGAELLRRLSAGGTSDIYVPPFKSTDGGKDAWDAAEWTNPADEPAARWLLGDLPENQRRIVARLVAAGPDGVSTSAVLAFGGYGPETSASPVFKALGGRFRRVGRKPVWRGGEQTDAGQILPVPNGSPRELFVHVIKTDYPELASELGL